MTNSTMRRGNTDAHTCKLNGWEVGTILSGDEGYGTEKIVLTAIGENHILARRIINADGEVVHGREGNWTLSYREWFESGFMSNTKTTDGHIELNLNNYNHDDVCQLNEWAIGAADRIEELEHMLKIAGQPGQHWECGCGHTNGANLSTCAACQRIPNSTHQPTQPSAGHAHVHLGPDRACGRCGQDLTADIHLRANEMYASK